MAMAVALPVFWYFSVKWLRALDPRWHSHAVWSIFVSGAVGALALIVYVTFLGTKEPFYEFMRRFGIYFYFLGTALAQLLLALSFRGICKGLGDHRLSDSLAGDAGVFPGGVLCVAPNGAIRLGQCGGSCGRFLTSLTGAPGPIRSRPWKPRRP
jgi:hypothetical protein